MDSDNFRAVGFRYEMEVAVEAAEEFGVPARFLKIGAPLEVPEFNKFSDIDLLFDDIAMQAKSSISALRTYRLERMEYWIQAAKTHPEVGRVIFAIPPGRIIPDAFGDLFEKYGVEVLRVTHLLD